jgi:hypothetical protein
MLDLSSPVSLITAPQLKSGPLTSQAGSTLGQTMTNFVASPAADEATGDFRRERFLLQEYCESFV